MPTLVRLVATLLVLVPASSLLAQDGQPDAIQRRLADDDSRFQEVRGVLLHYKEWGAGERTFLLLHGFGASVFSWREVVEPLAEKGRVIAYDRPAFGLTERPERFDPAWNPYGAAAQVDLAVGLMDALNVEQAILIAHSAGAPVALEVARRHPERVEALVMVAPAVAASEPPVADGILSKLLMKALRNRYAGPLLIRAAMELRGDAGVKAAWHDPSRVDTAILEGYRKPMKVPGWDRALWQMMMATVDSTKEAAEKKNNEPAPQPTLVIAGAQDGMVPPKGALSYFPDATTHRLEACGHLPHEERPQEFLEAVRAFLEELPDD